VAARDRLDAYWSTQPLTLIHGDSHIGNLYFIGERVGFFDWQVVQRGPGLRDLSYFLITSLPVEIRREHERAILGEYLAALRDAGGPAPASDRAWEQHRLHAFHAFVAAAVTAAARELQPDPVARAGLARACAALTDLESLRALERLAG
jgi:aminoglycoside phosphotransferase (APT) family kinase protein